MYKDICEPCTDGEKSLVIDVCQSITDKKEVCGDAPSYIEELGFNSEVALVVDDFASALASLLQSCADIDSATAEMNDLVVTFPGPKDFPQLLHRLAEFLQSDLGSNVQHLRFVLKFDIRDSLSLLDFPRKAFQNIRVFDFEFSMEEGRACESSLYNCLWLFREAMPSLEHLSLVGPGKLMCGGSERENLVFELLSTVRKLSLGNGFDLFDFERFLLYVQANPNCAIEALELAPSAFEMLIYLVLQQYEDHDRGIISNTTFAELLSLLKIDATYANLVGRTENLGVCFSAEYIDLLYTLAFVRKVPCDISVHYDAFCRLNTNDIEDPHNIMAVDEYVSKYYSWNDDFDRKVFRLKYTFTGVDENGWFVYNLDLHVKVEE